MASCTVTPPGRWEVTTFERGPPPMWIWKRIVGEAATGLVQTVTSRMALTRVMKLVIVAERDGRRRRSSRCGCVRAEAAGSAWG